MSFKLYKFCKMTVLMIFCVLSLGGIFSGLILSVIKSPTQQADLYAGQARLMSSENRAQDMALMALSYRPYDVAMWDLLRETRQETKMVNVPENSVSVLASSRLSPR